MAVQSTVFVSYSHQDNTSKDALVRHLAPLKTNGLVDLWHDRKLMPGDEFKSEINNNIEEAQVICLLISANFLASKSCIEEAKRALELRKKRCTSVVPIILSPCGWTDFPELAQLLALPTDAKPISSFADQDDAWNSVYGGIKDVVERAQRMRLLRLRDRFETYLQDPELLAKAHSNKEQITLEDIFVYPELEKLDELGTYQGRLNSGELVSEYGQYARILLAGADQSGKTAFLKTLFKGLREKGYVPIYVSLKSGGDSGKIENKISREFENQYEGLPFAEIDRQRIVPLIDDFHFARSKAKHIPYLSTYNFHVVTVDDVSSLNIKDEYVLKSYTRFKIVEFTPSMRNKLIRKWVSLSDTTARPTQGETSAYEVIDKHTELVDNALGRALGSGIMPSFPFFILSVISIYETFERPLDQEITSQGYCYQALIYMYLRKQGVTNEDIDTYINFLTEFAYFLFKSQKGELSRAEFDVFMKQYVENYNLPLKAQILLNTLQRTQIISIDRLNNWKFCYPYLFFFFAAKYLAEHQEHCADQIDNLLENLHKNENAYIAIFMTHHSRSDYIITKTIEIAAKLFDRHRPATLDKDELSFFDRQADIIVRASLPPLNHTAERERANRLELEDVHEQANSGESDVAGDESSDLMRELRRAVKTVEVLGCVIKNRAGSLEKSKLELVFSEAMSIQLRILTSFFEFIRDKNNETETVKFISDKLDEVIQAKESEDRANQRKSRPIDREKLEDISRRIFWNLNLFVVYGIVSKTVHSLGSNKLSDIIQKVCTSTDTTAAFLLKHGMLMWYDKNLQIDEISKRINDSSFSETSRRIMRFMIVNHCSMHTVGYKDRQRIESKLGISQQKLLVASIAKKTAPPRN